MKISGPAGLFLAFLALAAGMAGAWFLYSKPQVDEYQKLVNERNASISKAEEYQEKIDQINSTGVDYLGDLFRKVQVVDTLLPQEINRADVALDYTSHAQGLGLSVNNFDPGESGEGFETFQGTFTGSYEAITSFVSDIERSEHLVTIESMSIKGSESSESSGQYTLTMTLKFHTVSEPVLRPRVSQ